MTNPGIAESHAQPQTEDFPAARELRINLQNTINYTMDNALALSVILARPETLPWFYESYVQLYSLRVLRRPVSGFHDMVRDNQLHGDEIDSIAIHFAVVAGRRWFEECSVKRFLGDEPDDIIDFIIKSINRGFYLRLELDEYYLPKKRSFRSRQWVHPTLVYGYDNNMKTVHGLGFDTKIFTRLTFTYDDLRQAYESAQRISREPSINRPVVSVIRMREPPRRYPFSVERFLKELEGYLSSTIDSATKFYLTTFLPAHVEVDAVMRFGVSVYEHFESGLRELLRGNVCLTYVPMHALFEHKRFLLEAFRFVISEYQMKRTLVELTEDFQHVVQAFHSMRWKFLRYEHTKDTQLIIEIIEQLRVARADECQLLQRIHDEIQSSHFKIV